MGRIKDVLFWWLPVRNRLFLDKYNEFQHEINIIKKEIKELEELKEIKQLSKEIKQLSKEIEYSVNNKNQVLIDIRKSIDEIIVQQEHQKNSCNEKMWQISNDLHYTHEQNARLERILTHYHKQNMKMFWEEYRREGESTEDAQKRFFLSLPKAQGYERNLQLLESVLLKKFVEICEEHGLRYWLDSGTLLGAVRHNGFVPWDDDTDTGMLREDIDKLREILKDDPDYRLTVRYDAWGYCKQIRFCFRDSKLPVFVDVFPNDWTTSDNRDVWDSFKAVRQKLTEEISDESNPLIRDFRSAGCVDEDSEIGKRVKNIFDKYYNQLLGDGVLCNEAQAKGCLLSFDSWSYCDHGNIVAKDITFPLQKMEFEGIKCNVPHKSIYILQQFYGMDFYTFPCGEPHFQHADWKSKEKILEEEVQKWTDNRNYK